MEIEEYQSRGSYLAEWSGFRMANGKYYTSGESIMLQHQLKSYCFLLLVIHQDTSNPNKRYYNVFAWYVKLTQEQIYRTCKNKHKL